MTLVNNRGIGTQTFTAIPLPKTGDREEFTLRVVGPDPSNDFQVPMIITGTALAIWGSPNPTDAAEALGAAVFRVTGTASQPPPEGYWFDSYNSGENVQDTANKIANEGALPFIKNAPSALFVRGLGQEINKKILELDALYSTKYNQPFFFSLEDLSEESQRIDDLNNPASDNANFLYRVCILSGIIDHINVRLSPEDIHQCTVCNQRHKQSEGSLSALRRWLKDKVNDQEATRLTQTFQMIKNLRKQYPIHDHYETASNIRQVRKQIRDATIYFDLNRDFAHNGIKLTEKFGESIKEIKIAIENIT